MKERFGTDYMQLNGNGRYTGLDGIALFYRDIAEKLCILPEMEEKIEKKTEETRMLAKESLAYLGSKHCVLVCRGISDAPFTLKLFAKEFGVGIGALCVILTEEQRRSLKHYEGHRRTAGGTHPGSSEAVCAAGADFV